jgi:hypothetical protein
MPILVWKDTQVKKKVGNKWWRPGWNGRLFMLNSEILMRYSKRYLDAKEHCYKD